MCYTLMGSVQKKKNKEEKLPKKLWEIKVCREKAREKVKKKSAFWNEHGLILIYYLITSSKMEGKKKKGERDEIYSALEGNCPQF